MNSAAWAPLNPPEEGEAWGELAVLVFKNNTNNLLNLNSLLLYIVLVV